nr:DUF6004 family protein [Kitasatospora sp. MBT66]
MRRFCVLETSALRLANREGIDTQGAIIDHLPPYRKPLLGPGDLTLVIDSENEYHGELSEVFAATNLPVAWYPVGDDDEPSSTMPKAFFTPGPTPFTVVMFNPTMIIQSSLEGRLELEVGGKSVRVDLVGDRGLAAGVEILLFGPDEHNEGPGVRARISRLALTGHCTELGGRIMLRVSWPRPSTGTLGNESEDSLSRVRYPSELHINTEFELITPDATLRAKDPVHIAGKLRDLDATGTELRMEGAATALVTAEDTVKATLTGVTLLMGETVLGAHAPVDV